jgi:hypothetical protein
MRTDGSKPCPKEKVIIIKAFAGFQVKKSGEITLT